MRYGCYHYCFVFFFVLLLFPIDINTGLDARVLTIISFSQNLIISKGSPGANDIPQGEQVNGDGNDKYEIFDSQVCF